MSFFETADKANGGDGIVWAKASAPRGAQVILEMKHPNGARIKVPPIRAGDPVCLSKYAPFHIIKEDSDLLQCIINGLIRPMTSKQAAEHFSRKAEILKSTPELLMRKSDEEARRAMFSKPLEESQVDTKALIDTSQAVMIEDTVNPRVQHLCAQVSPMLKDEQRMPVKEFLAELHDMADFLTVEDLEYVRSQGYYPSARKWATQTQAHVMKSQGLMPEEDELT